MTEVVGAVLCAPPTTTPSCRRSSKRRDRALGVCPSDGETGTSGQVMGHAPKNRHSQDDNLARAAVKISLETLGSATILEIVSAPSIVARNTLADFFARSVPGSFIRSATSAIILRIPLVAADRVDLSDLASSLPSAARGHPWARSFLCSGER